MKSTYSVSVRFLATSTQKLGTLFLLYIPLYYETSQQLSGDSEYGVAGRRLEKGSSSVQIIKYAARRRSVQQGYCPGVRNVVLVASHVRVRGICPLQQCQSVKAIFFAIAMTTSVATFCTCWTQAPGALSSLLDLLPRPRLPPL
jgi:hypothetical protein